MNEKERIPENDIPRSMKRNVYRLEGSWEDSIIADEGRHLITEGRYQAQCISYEKGRPFPNSLKLFLHFKIADGKYFETPLFMAINLMDSKTGKPIKRARSGTKYCQNWIIANYYNQPSRGQPMNPKNFLNGVFEVLVRTVKPKFPDGTEKPSCFHYSIINSLIRRLA
jgi:hypothetical protein